MKLIAFGCSNTFGQFLPDVWNEETELPIDDEGPSQFAWPQILADKLNLKCCNFGEPGISNKEIWYNIVNGESFFEIDDIVIICWTYSDRNCIIKSKEIKQLRYWDTLDVESRSYYKYIHDYYDMSIDLYMRMNYIKYYLDKKNIFNYHIMLDEFCGPCKGNYLLRWNYVEFSNISFSRDLDKAKDNKHPGLESHKAFGTEIYNKIKKKIHKNEQKNQREIR
jgi:hypothetical protein|tara:strand:- start:437 stop:1102 length:666 start_codon:yes stop_codon:yes gene_type:complete